MYTNFAAAGVARTGGRNELLKLAEELRYAHGRAAV